MAVISMTPPIWFSGKIGRSGDASTGMPGTPPHVISMSGGRGKAKRDDLGTKLAACSSKSKDGPQAWKKVA